MGAVMGYGVALQASCLEGFDSLGLHHLINTYMRINEITEPITPNIKWRQNGDNSYTIRIEYAPDKVYVHTNKNPEVLKKLIADRYGPKTFV